MKKPGPFYFITTFLVALYFVAIRFVTLPDWLAFPILIILLACLAISLRQLAISRKTLGGENVETNIPKLRKQHKLSQEELAAAVGVTRQTITSLETGKYTASLVLAWRIARYFGLRIEEVFDFSKEEVF